MNCILNDIGWQEGKIPILNAENKAIQDEVRNNLVYIFVSAGGFQTGH